MFTRRELEYQLPLYAFSLMSEEEKLKGILAIMSLALAVGYAADNYWYYGHYTAQIGEMLSEIVHHFR